MVTKKPKRVLKKSVKNFITRVLITSIIFLATMIVIKQNSNIKTLIVKNVLEESFEFTKAKEIYQKYFGKILSVDKIVKEQEVFSEKLTYTKANAYKDGVKLTVTNNYMVPLLESGIVVFMGEKEGYGQSVVVEQINGIDVLYSNIESKNIKLYDYVEKGSLVGETKDDKLYLVFQKGDKFLDYNEYI